jgi:hypothetical protein
MFNRIPWKKNPSLNDIISTLETHIKEMHPDSEEYSKLVDQLGKLYQMKERNSSSRVSPDALVSAAASILAVLLILNHEKLGVVTSKAMGFIRIR